MHKPLCVSVPLRVRSSVCASLVCERVKMDDQTIDYKKKMTGKNNGIQLKYSLVFGVIVSVQV